MGTRSLTVVQDNQGNEIVVLYRQMDGYPSGHGQELADFLKDFVVVNGLGAGQPAKITNGMPCLAALLVSHFKGDEPGNFYLYPAGTRDCGEEWIYTVKPGTQKGTLHLEVQAGAVTYFGLPGTKQHRMPVLFSGAPADFNADAIEQAREQQEIQNDFLETQKKK